MADSCGSASVRREEGSDKEAVLSEKDADRPCESIDSSDCSNHSTTTSTTDKSDKDTEQSSDSESKQPSARRLYLKTGTGAIRSSFILRPSSFGAPPFMNVLGASGAVPVTSSKMLLRPSALADQASKLNTYSSQPTKTTNSTNNKPEFNLKPVLANPFSKDGTDSANTENGSTPQEKEEPKEPEVDGAATGGFVFGQNLHERVANVDQQSDEENKQTPLLFNAGAAATGTENNSEVANNENSPNRNKSLSLRESAQEYEASKQVKRKYEEVEVKTGEEDESNVLQINCKLFAFEKAKGTWQERGRGLLRLNDTSSKSEAFNSRVVMRITGSLRVVLNTMVWSGMAVEKASDKTVRLTAIDNDQIKIFLVMASPKDSETLYSALDCRIASLKNQEGVTGEKNLPFPPLNPPKKLRTNSEELR